MRVILYTGKGGVGKTSMAAATACKLAKEGKKVLIMSTDQAHSLSDSFGLKCGRGVTTIIENLDALEIDSVYESEQNWAQLKGYFKELLTHNSQGGIEVEELLVFPGLEELFSMLKVLSFVKKEEYDVILLDCAPTGETLSLLKYPEKLSGFLEKVLPMKRKAIKYAGPFVEKTMDIPMPEDSIFDDIERIISRLDELQQLMLNKDVLSIRIVTTPEQIVINEAIRNFTCMHLYDYNVDAIIVNKIYEEKAMEGYFSKWIEKQQEGLTRIQESFSEIPQFYMNLQNTELQGISALTQTGEVLFDKADPSEILFSKKIYEVNDEISELSIYLPGAQKEDLELQMIGNEMILSFKNQSRRFPIPTKWRDREIASAKLDDDYLRIRVNKMV